MPLLSNILFVLINASRKFQIFYLKQMIIWVSILLFKMDFPQLGENQTNQFLAYYSLGRSVWILNL
ncbi:hypothetical protein DF185_12880 [Marinifilum breve]|uniref:Uncharacterized protein n=1 Tax=Marinifilum breve TaxID=2184082 RepID=A0A2V3ZX05_9BACT|nr:hypothetical protein DF185_12880 [Marinifilum breve]